MRHEGLGARLLRRLHSNLLVVAGPRPEPGWPGRLGQGRTGRARLFTNCHTPAGGSAVAAAILLTGSLPEPGDLADELWRVSVPHLGHHLAASHYRLALLEAPPAASDDVRRGVFAAGFDEVRVAGPGSEGGVALRAAVEDLVAAPRRAALPWFLFAQLPGETLILEGLAALMAGRLRHSTTLVVYDTAAAQVGATRRTPLWLEFPSRSELIDPELVAHPHLVSPLDLLPTLLGEGAPAHPAARDLMARGSAFRRDLLAATFGADPAADDEAAADFLLQLAGTREPPTEAGRFEPISFVVAVDDPAELHSNLLRCPPAHRREHEWLLVDNSGGGYSSISRLYDDAHRRAAHDLVLFCHQDVFLPEGWEARFFAALAAVERADPNWGVIGSVGVIPRPSAIAATRRRRVSHLRGHWADPAGHHYAGPLPHAVECLDEMWLGLRRSSGVRFDPDLPGFHCYGIDVSLTARRQGRRSYATDSFVWHKHRDAQGRVITRPQESQRIQQRGGEEFRRRYAESYDYVAGKWRHMGPFASTSAEWPALSPEPGHAAEDGPVPAPEPAGGRAAHPAAPAGRIRSAHREGYP